MSAYFGFYLPTPFVLMGNMLKKIVSGGQTGADRAALDSALRAGFPCGGFCPFQRQAEDGTIPNSYPLTEIKGGYNARTEQNVIYSDGTVIFFEDEPQGGTQLTVEFCLTHAKPHLLIDSSVKTPQEAAWAIEDFVYSHSVEALNVAGPRSSESPDIYRFVRQSFDCLFQIHLD
jgi:hypothetical protein